MKLISCPECKDLILLVPKDVRICYCGKHGGKYLNDHITAVVNKGAILVGLDNNSFTNAKKTVMQNKDKWEHRVDFFFVGWIPTKPGEVIFVDTLDEVLEFDNNYDAENTFSTMPVSL